MKAVLIRRKVVPPYTHDLVRLNHLLRKAVSGLKLDDAELDLLSTGAVLLRYPGKSSARSDALRSMRICKAARKELDVLL
jgi:HEPN domain-containing protein